MTYGYPTNPPYVMGASLLTVFPLGSSLESVFGMGSPPTGSAYSISQSSLVGWYKADAITGFTSGSSLTIWQNSSQAGDVTKASAVSQGSAASQPIYLTAQLNGLPVVSCIGGQEMKATDLNIAQPYTLFTVSSCSSTAAQLWTCNHHLNQSGTPRIFSGSVFNTGLSVATATTIFVGGIFNGSSSTVAAGTSSASTTITGNPNTSAVISWGICDRAGSGNFWQGNIAEVILYARALPNSEFLSVISYITGKYAI